MRKMTIKVIWGLSGSGSKYHVQQKNGFALCKPSMYMWDKNVVPEEDKKCKRCMKIMKDEYRRLYG